VLDSRSVNNRYALSESSLARNGRMMVERIDTVNARAMEGVIKCNTT
jgi:hypothetical protein